ncbi:DNA primase [Conexibacter arvalis]|uniref:DNA primase n=1 Tax=Conexibacter arvalis TaxID=912552 RepID=A0A840ILM5_9ACTN|nr:DNA primase [Conexibacter arvalis]
MSRYTADSKDRVRDAVDMIALVSTRTELRRAGHNSYFGRCPFHDERTGSFHVRPEEKHYHCFGCQESGDPFDFVMQTEGLDFRGALESLAQRFGVALELEDEDPQARARRERRERLHSLLDRAAAYYARYLWESNEAARARDYLAARGLNESTLRTFRVGYAPSAWDKMLLGSRQAGFSEDELLATGLAQRSRQRRGSLYDRFRERIMFPLADSRGRVVGFGARAMRDNQPPKYLNTSEGEVFHKGSQLFGIDIARRPASRAGSIVLAEGYTDVLALHQAGIENAVGVMGTSLTDEQARELERTARTLVLALDADGAGQEAMVRASRIAAGRRLELRVVSLPQGMDPADLIQRDGAEAVRERVGRSVPFVSFHVDKVLASADLGDAEGKDRALAELRPVIAPVPPSVLREELIARIAARLGLSDQLAATLLEQQAAPAAAAPARTASAPAAGDGGWDDRWSGESGRHEPSWEGPGADDESAYWASLADADPGPERGAPAPTATSVASAPAASARAERDFLALCVALPREGAQALAWIDPEQHLTSAIARRCAEHLRAPGRLEAPMDDVPDGDVEQFVFELVKEANDSGATSPSLEHARLVLELGRLARAVAVARAEGTGGITELKRAEGDVRRQLAALSEQIQASG